MKKTIKKLHRKHIHLIRSCFLGSLIGAFIAFNLPVIEANENIETPTLNPQVTEIATSTPSITTISWNDAIREIFPKDEAGRMIRICLEESGNKYAINYNTNGTYDYSWCQINSCHKPKTMTDSEWKSYLDDPINHAKEVRKIYLSQGWGAWVVSRWTK